jgi:3-oxoacyl-[acyl-carrier protein] reductase
MKHLFVNICSVFHEQGLSILDKSGEGHMDKVAIVTGAGGGLGSEICRKLVSTGANVALTDVAQEPMNKVAEEINKGPGQSFAYRADVREYEEVKAVVEETVGKWGRIDVLVNAAGGTLSMLARKDKKLLVDHTEEEWDLVVDVNLKGSFNCIKAVAPQMIKQKDGHIILVSSGTGLRPGPFMSSYAAAKAGIFGLMKAAARELGEYNVKVNAVNPGLIPHALLYPPGGQAPDAYIPQTMLGRLAAPEDLADLIIFLGQRNNLSGQIFNNDSRVFF